MSYSTLHDTCDSHLAYRANVQIVQSRAVTTETTEHRRLLKEMLAHSSAPAKYHPAIVAHKHELQWEAYLNDLVQHGTCQPGLIRSVKEFRKLIHSRVSEACRALRIPQAGPTEEGFFQLVWDAGEHHFEADIKPDGHFDWFYRNRRTGHYEGDEDCSLKSVSPSVLQHCIEAAS